MTSLVISDLWPRCWHCNKLLAEKVSRPWTIRCTRCKTVITEPEAGDARSLVIENSEPLHR